MTTCAAIATTWSAKTHSMLLYGDARSHLNVARHVTDGLRPGLVQLGSVWLPLPHILLIPLVFLPPLAERSGGGHRGGEAASSIRDCAFSRGWRSLRGAAQVRGAHSQSTPEP